MTALETLRSRLTDGPHLATIGPNSPPSDDACLLRRCLFLKGIGPQLWGTLPDEALRAYSPDLRKYIIQFQDGAGIEKDGVCGNETWGHLAGFKSSSPLELPSSSLQDQLRTAVVAEARASLHVRETGGPNRGQEVEALQVEGGGRIGDYWCAEAIAAWRKRACKKLKAAVPFKINPSTDIVASQADAAGRLKPAKEGRKGDALLIGKVVPGKKLPDMEHIGLIVENTGDGWLSTIEGNTNNNGSSNGNGVYARRRRINAGMRAVDICGGVTLA